MLIPDDLRYTNEHEWIRIEGDIAVVGLTDYAQDQLEDIVYLDLPEPGMQVKQHDAFGSVEAVKAVEDIYSPVSGELVEVNSELEDKPELCNQKPYGDGWLVKIKMSDTSEVDNLLTAEQYRELL
ncbi:glycine cleavage system protein GcvH [candidate division KSB1 bacterium]